MPPDPAARIRRLLLVGGVYLSQGAVYGFATLVLIPALAAAGASLQVQTGVLALAGVPWVLKLVWAVALDMRRVNAVPLRRIVAVACAMMAICCAAIGWIDEPLGSIARLAWLWLALNVAASLQDVATDAMILDETPAPARGLVGSVMLGSHHLGAEGLGVMVLGAWFAAHGLGSALWMLALVLALVASYAWITASRDRPARAPVVDLGALAEVLARPSTWSIVVLAGSVLAAEVLTSAVAGDFLVRRLGWTLEGITGVLAPVLLVSNVGGYLVASRVCDRIGHARTLGVGGVALGALWLGFAAAAPLWPQVGFILGFVVVQAVATALLYVGLHAVLMDAADAKIRATHFAALSSLTNLPRVFVPPLAVGLLAQLDYTGLFAASGVAQMLFCGAVLVAVRRAWLPGGARVDQG